MWVAPVCADGGIDGVYDLGGFGEVKVDDDTRVDAGAVTSGWVWRLAGGAVLAAVIRTGIEEVAVVAHTVPSSSGNDLERRMRSAAKTSVSIAGPITSRAAWMAGRTGPSVVPVPIMTRCTSPYTSSATGHAGVVAWETEPNTTNTGEVVPIVAGRTLMCAAKRVDLTSRTAWVADLRLLKTELALPPIKTGADAVLWRHFRVRDTLHTVPGSWSEAAKA